MTKLICFKYALLLPVDFMQPALHITKAFGISCVVDDDDSVCSSVVTRCDCSESFLACSIPLKSANERNKK